MSEYALGTGPITCRSCKEPLKHICVQCPSCGKTVDSATLLMLVTAKVEMGEERQTILAQLRSVLSSMPSVTPAARAHFGRAGPSGKVASLITVQASGDASEFPASVLEMSYVRADRSLKVEIVRTLGMAGTEDSVRVLQRIIEEEKDPDVLKSFGESMGHGDANVDEITFPSLEVDPKSKKNIPPPAPAKNLKLPPRHIEEKDAREAEAVFDSRRPSDSPLGPDRPVSNPPPSLLGSVPPGASSSSTESIEEIFDVGDEAFGELDMAIDNVKKEPSEQTPPPLVPPKEKKPPQTPEPTPQQAPPQQTPEPTPQQATPEQPQAPASPTPAPVPDPGRVATPRPAGRKRKNPVATVLVGLFVAVVGVVLGGGATVGLLWGLGFVGQPDDDGQVTTTSGMKEHTEQSGPSARPAGPQQEQDQEETEQATPAQQDDQEETEEGQEDTEDGQETEEAGADEQAGDQEETPAPVAAPPAGGGAKLAYEVSANSQHSKYPASNLSDGDVSTVWQEQKGEWSVGQKLHVEFDEPHTLTKLGIVVGYDLVHDKKGDLWPQNNRAKSLQITLSDGTEVQADLEDDRKMQWIALPASEPVSEIMLKITDVYRGSKYNDNAISEIQIWGN